MCLGQMDGRRADAWRSFRFWETISVLEDLDF